jgi:hypothetical protein
MIANGVAREQPGERLLVDLPESNENGVRRTGGRLLLFNELEAGTGQGSLEAFGPGRCVTDEQKLGTGMVRCRRLVHAWQRGEWIG